MSEIKKPAKTAVKKTASPKVPAKTPVKQTRAAAIRQEVVQTSPPQQAWVAPQQQQVAPPQQPVTETFIVQNTFEGPLYISDIGMEFGGLEVRDLTWEDPAIVKRSQDLRRAISLGHLIRISQDSWDRIMHIKAAEARAETSRISNRRTRTVNADGRILEAEVLNLNKADGGRAAQDQVSTAGHANDPMSYATAFSEARMQYEDRGVTLDAHTFAGMVRKQPSLVARLLNREDMFDDGVISGATGRGRATVISPGNDGQYGTNVNQVNMTNYNRDQRLAGSSAMGLGSLQNDQGYIDPFNPNAMPHGAPIPDFVDLDNLEDDEGYAEEIDLASDFDDSSGGVRRLG
jgi:hypothetical protein